MPCISLLPDFFICIVTNYFMYLPRMKCNKLICNYKLGYLFRYVPPYFQTGCVIPHTYLELEIKP